MRLDTHFLESALPNVECIKKTSCAIVFSRDYIDSKSTTYFVLYPEDDVHTLIPHLLDRNVYGFLISTTQKELVLKLVPDFPLIIVADVKRSLCMLASVWRSNFNYPVIGITGSVGKSCTKMMLSNILDAQDIPHVISVNSTNQPEDLALDILKMNNHHQMALFEMGIQRRNQMSELADMVHPSYALITNVGHSNMEGLGATHDIAIELRTIFKNFTQESIGIVNGDMPILGNIGYVHPVIKFGSKTVNQVQARKVAVTDTHTTFTLKIYKKKYTVTLSDTNRGSVFNALSAAAIAHLVDIDPEMIVHGIQKPLAMPRRFERRQLTFGTGTLIDDCANSNPESMKAALLAFQQLDTKGQKIVILGDMKGLGVNSPFWHRQIGRFLRKVSSVKHLILVGDMVRWTRKTLPVRITSDLVPTWDDAAQKLKERLDQESLVLVKGSGGQLKNLIEQFSKQAL
jgi:UDP-N-acetylmuramoyl-tripeptide--D-alanyl-D-alanine ligase